MKTNSYNEAVVNAIKSVKGCQFISMAYISEPTLNKAQKAAIGALSGNGEPLPVIEKRTRGQFQINFSYENAVNNRGAKEQGEPINFVAAPLQWGSWVAGQENKLIENKGILYLRYYGVQNGKVESEYFVNGVAANEAQIALIKQFSERPIVKSQANAGLTDNQVICRVVKIDNITEITINGVTFKRKKAVQVA